MNYDKRNELLKECKIIRNILEKNKNNMDVEWFKFFPRGCCKEASLVLAKHLHKKEFGIADIICGERNCETHIWLEIEGVIVDITADQFEDIDEAVIVVESSIFHDKFEKKGKSKYTDYFTGNEWGINEIMKVWIVINDVINI